MPRPSRIRAPRRSAFAPALLLIALLCPAVGSGPAAARARPAPALHAAAPRSRAAKPGARAKRKTLQFTIAPSLVAAPGVPVSTAPVGLSVEYPVMAAALGSGACPPPALAHELIALGSPALQLAGASQDLTAPAGVLATPPASWEAATLYPLPSNFWSALHCLLQSSRDPLTVGLDMRTGTLAWAQQMVGEARAAAVNGLSFSIGNEPDLYGLPNYASLDKPLPEEELAASKLYVQLAGELSPALGGAPLIGPELALPQRWRAQLPRVLKATHVQAVGVHMYPLTACSTPRAVTIGGLLSSSAADAPARLRWVVADAQAEGLPALISEANSASCGGVAGVSDSPAASVWAVRFVLSALKSGFREVRFHLSGNSYDPFLVQGSTVLQRPLQSALLALNRWLAVGSTVRSVHAGRGVLASAISQPGGAVVLILDNEGAKAQPLLLRATGALQVQALVPTRAGVHVVSAASSHGATRLSLAPNTVLAVSAAPPPVAPPPAAR